jgi:hypothetical protein
MDLQPLDLSLHPLNSDDLYPQQDLHELDPQAIGLELQSTDPMQTDIHETVSSSHNFSDTQHLESD